MSFSALLPPLGIGWAVMAALMAILWARTWRHNAGIVDVAWSAGMGVLAALYLFSEQGWQTRRTFVGALALVWSVRLATYLFRRVVGKEEDGRYVQLKANWGTRAGGYFFAFYQAQAFFAVVFSLPILVAMTNPRPRFAMWDAAGFVIWIIAVAGEAVADRQLANFRTNPANRGKTCRAGLWSWSRHPNYFFEWIHWWAYVAFAIGHSVWWLTLLGPVLMLWLLFKVTGIPTTEAQAVKTRGDDYREYQRTTSAFVPWPPRR